MLNVSPQEGVQFLGSCKHVIRVTLENGMDAVLGLYYGFYH